VTWPAALAGTSPAARRLREAARELASRFGAALIVAPAGFDAALIARTVHRLAAVAGPCITVECGAPAGRVDERLFGPVPARRAPADFIESLGPESALVAARHGTLVLVSVADLPVSTQARLARVLRDGEARVNGGQRRVRLDVRVIATTELPLEEEVRHARFRSDLYKRLAAHVLRLPPLRERREDIGAMAQALMTRLATDAGVPPRPFTHAAIALIGALAWDGNLAELEGFVRELVSAGTTAPVRVEDVIAQVDPGAVTSVGMPRASLREARRQFEREYIEAVLRQSGWRMGQAARVLGIQRTNLYRKARQLGIARAKAGE
jgi:two-component system nitrogen regulation response regulator NtrX